MTTRERLAAALEEAGAPKEMAERARGGDYDDFESPRVTPMVDLVKDLRRLGMEAMARRAMNGEFDGTREEAETWFRGWKGDPVEE